MLLAALARVLPGLIFTALLPGAFAQIVYVDATLTTGANDGSSWDDAYQGGDGLRSAIGNAPSGAEIWATSGTYRSLAAAQTGFLVTTADLTLRGGFMGGEGTPFERAEPDQFPTVLSGDALGDDDGTNATTSDNCQIVLEVVQAPVWTMERIVITSAADTGFVARNADAQVRDCHFVDCATRGAFLTTQSSASGLGFAGNVADCRFAGNGSDGLFYFGRPNPDRLVSVDRCLFEHNDGRGINIGNTLPNRALIANSISRFNGQAGIQITSQSDGANVEVNRCTLVGNGAFGLSYVGVCGICFQPSAQDNLIWENVGPELDSGAQNISSGGFVQGSAAAAPFGTDDVFEDFAAGDLRPRAGSPLIDAGSSPPLSSGQDFLDFARSFRVYDDPAAASGGSPSASADVGALERSPFIGSRGDCAVQPNSTGAPGRILALGSLSVAANNLTLLAQGLPPEQFGIFIVSRQAGSTPFLVGSLSTLCLGGAIGRFSGPGQVLSSGAGGAFSLPVDVVELAQFKGIVQVQPGGTWRFQAWHRDVPLAGIQQVQFTDMVVVRFR